MEHDELLSRLVYHYGYVSQAQRKAAEEKAKAAKAVKKAPAKKGKASSGKASGGGAADKAALRTSFMDTALHVFKVRTEAPRAGPVVFQPPSRHAHPVPSPRAQGAVANALELPTGGSTSAFKFEKDQTFRLTVALGDKVRSSPRSRASTRRTPAPPHAIRPPGRIHPHPAI